MEDLTSNHHSDHSGTHPESRARMVQGIVLDKMYILGVHTLIFQAQMKL
jgi:hypothetical protein